MSAKLAILSALEDAAGRRELETHLAIMRRNGHYEPAQHEEAAFLLVLVSAHLLADAALYDVVRAAHARGVRLLPVRFASCDVSEFFDRITWAGPDKDWIASARAGKTDELWTAVIRAVGQVLGVQYPHARW